MHPLRRSEAAPAQSPTSAAYAYLNLAEQAFVEALVDHMVPADELSPKGTDLGINIYIDRALAGGWGKGDRLYMQGPWKLGAPSQGYQLPLTPAELYRAGIAAANAYCVKTYGKSFDKITESQREEFLLGLQAGKVTFENGLPAARFLHHDVSERHGRHVRRPDLRRQPEQGGLEDDRLPRRDRRALSRTSRSFATRNTPPIPISIADMTEPEDDMATQTEGSRRRHRRPRLDRRHPREGTDRGRDEGRRARARRHAQHRPMISRCRTIRDELRFASATS